MTMMLNRRHWMLGALSATACAGTSARSLAQPFFQAHNLPVGIQIYTLSDLANADLADTLKKVAAIGFQTIELAGYYGRTPAQLRAAIDAAGLTCPSAHIPGPPSSNSGPSLSGDLHQLAADAHILGIQTIIMPTLLFPANAPARSPGERTGDYLSRIGPVMTSEDWKANAAFLNRVAGILKAQGLRFGYHNHNPEFAPLPGGGTGMDILLAETDPALVEFEMDAGWVTAAGRDVIALLRANPGRFRNMHVKDIKPSTKPNYVFRQDPTTVGKGMIDWRAILPVAFDAGVRGFFVEQEPPFETDRLSAVASSYAYLKSLKA